MRHELLGTERGRSLRAAAAIVAVLATLSTGTARAQGYIAPPPSLPGVAAPGALDARYLAEYRAPHVAVIAPKRTRGKALLGTGIAVGAVGFVMLIVGAALAEHKRYDWDITSSGDWITQPYRTTGFITVGAGAGMLVLGGGLIAAGAVPLTEAKSHEQAIGGLVVSFAR